MKQYLNNNEILLQFDTGLKKLLEKNPKENIDKLSFIAIKHNYLTKNFVQLIFKYNDMAPRIEFRINLLYLIDSICKSETQNNSRKYIELFEKDIVSTFVKIYIQSSHSDDLKRQLRLLRMTWRNIFQESSLKEMKLKVMDLEKEDIDCNFSEEDLQKLMDYYQKNNISFDFLTNIKKNKEVPVNNGNLVLGKRAKNQIQKDLEDPKIKKKTKKVSNQNIVNNNNNNNNEINQNTLANNLNYQKMINQSQTQNFNVTKLSKPSPNPIKNVSISSYMETFEKNQQNLKIQENSYENNMNIINPTQNQNVQVVNIQNNIQRNIEEKKQVTQSDKDEEISKEKLRSLFTMMRQNNPQIFFYILYKNFKDEMTRQISKKTLHVSNIKTKQEFVINSLYSDLKFKCNSCGTRFNLQKNFIEHLDHHFSMNKYLFDIQKRDKMIERTEFLKNDEWLSFEATPESKKKMFTLTEEAEHWIEADSLKNKCSLCEENFNMKYLGKKEIWIFENAILADIEEKNQVGVPFHYDCYKILLAQEEEIEYLNEVNIIKKNEHLIKSKTNNNKNHF